MGFFIFGCLVIACLIYGLEQVLLVLILLLGLGALSTFDPKLWAILIFLIGFLAFITR